MFTITEHWLREFKTSKGAWNKMQLQAIGINFPPQKGWMNSVVGTEITHAQKTAFEKNCPEFEKKKKQPSFTFRDKV